MAMNMEWPPRDGSRTQEDVIQEMVERIVAAKMAEIDAARAGNYDAKAEREQIVRMECLALFVKESNFGPRHCVGDLNRIDMLTQYVLNGARPAKDAADDISALKALTPTNEAQPAPDSIVLSGDHMIWTVAIGNDHTAMIFMHQDDYAVLTGKKPGEA